MSTYVLLTDIQTGSRDTLLEKSVTQDILDRAEEYFKEYVKDKGIADYDLTIDDIPTPVSFRCKEWIIAKAFKLTAGMGSNSNLGVLSQQGSETDAYTKKIKQYSDHLKSIGDGLSIDVIYQTDFSARSRMAKEIRVLVG